MKKSIVLLLAASVAFSTCSCSLSSGPSSPELEFVANLHDWDPEGVDHESWGWVQGLAVWKNYAVVCHDGGMCVVYDLKKKKHVNHFQLPGQKSHCNNAMFGWDKYSADSAFPLLYVTDCVDCGKCYVYDFSADGATLVQTIHLKEKPAGENGGNGWYCDAEKKTLCMHWTGVYWENLPMPAKDDTDPVISIEGVDPDGEMALPAIHQGACRFKGVTYFPCGFDKDPFITVKRNGGSEDFPLEQIAVEPEGICGYGKYVYVTFCKDYCPLLYRFKAL